ncbi:MAG: nucleotidyl transferase AbiEii/AbiGii toxin family protein, partial [Desulfatitalea sp.]
MLNPSNPYFRQVDLLLALMPLVGRESCFALKGGSAINLFVRDLPRLSVDLDLTFLPVKDRAQSLAEMDAALGRIATAITRALPGADLQQTAGRPGECTKLLVMRDGIRVKVEASPVLRGAVNQPGVRGVCPSVESQFGYVEMPLLHPHDLYAGKLCAALDRQHPRDLFDVKLLLENEGIGDELLQVFLVYLISGNRPLAELIAPQFQPLEMVFETQFKGMTMQPIGVAELEETRRTLVKLIQERLTEKQRRFLLSFKQGVPEWSLL